MASPTKDGKSTRKTPKSKKGRKDPPYMRFMQIIVSLFALGAGIYFMRGGNTNDQTIAGAWVGVVLGYWLR